MFEPEPKNYPHKNYPSIIAPVNKPRGLKYFANNYENISPFYGRTQSEKENYNRHKNLWLDHVELLHEISAVAIIILEEPMVMSRYPTRTEKDTRNRFVDRIANIAGEIDLGLVGLNLKMAKAIEQTKKDIGVEELWSRLFEIITGDILELPEETDVQLILVVAITANMEEAKTLYDLPQKYLIETLSVL